MKYNLKNRPKLSDFEDNYQYINETEGWFKESEKELRELPKTCKDCKSQTKFFNEKTYCLKHEFAKEILGTSQACDQ